MTNPLTMSIPPPDPDKRPSFASPTFWIAGQRVTADDLRHANVAFGQQLLRHDHERGVRPHCLCRDPGVDMCIRHRATTYYLARLPNSGPKHHPACTSFDLAGDQSGRSGYAATAIATDDAGVTRVQLDSPLTRSTGQLRTKPIAVVKDRPMGPSQSRQKTSLLGLLHHLWSEAKLNRWYPKMHSKRGWWTVHDCLRELAPRIIIQRASLSDRLYVTEPYRGNVAARRDAFLAFMQRVTRHDSAVQNLALLIADIHALKPTEHGGRLTLNELRDIPFWLNRDVFAEMTGSFVRPLHVLNQAQSTDRVVGLFVVGPSAKHDDQFYVHDAGLMHVSARLIPLDSSYEGRVETALAEQGRAYIKPLRYDAHSDVVFPDFFLLDAGEVQVPMEIYGFTGLTAYEQRKREKMRHYEQSGEPFWYWDVAASKDFPAFPPQTHRQRRDPEVTQRNQAEPMRSPADRRLPIHSKTHHSKGDSI